MNGISRSSPSIWPSVDLPAPRSPTSAMRRCRAGSTEAVPSISPSATRTRRRSASLRCSSSSRISSHSGELVVTSPTSSASEQCSAPATCCSTRIDALPMPYSRFARWRSDTSADRATALRVRPRCARRLRTRSPSATSSGFLASPATAAPWLPVPPSGAVASTASTCSFMPFLVLRRDCARSG
ncbi:hypothetical protein D3C72_1632060 [compost metagenome]